MTMALKRAQTIKMAPEDIGKTRPILRHHILCHLTQLRSYQRLSFVIMSLSWRSFDCYRQHCDVHHL